MIYGYLNEGFEDEDHVARHNVLKEAGVDCIYREKNYCKKERPQFDDLIKTIKYGDTFIIWKLSRIGYSIKDMAYKVRVLLEAGVYIKSIKENLDIPTGQGKFMVEALTIINNFTHSIQSERTLAGLERALLEGHIGGRPKSVNSKTPGIEKHI